MDPKLQKAIKMQIIMRCLAALFLVILAVGFTSYVGIKQGAELSRGIIRESATEEEMTLYASDLELPEIEESTFLSGELKGNPNNGIYRFTLTLDLDPAQTTKMRAAVQGFEETDPEEATINPKPELFYVRREPPRGEEQEDRVLRVNFYLEEENTSRCILQWTMPGKRIRELYTGKKQG